MRWSGTVTRDPKQLVRDLVDAYNDKSLERILQLYDPEAYFWDPFHRDGIRGREALGAVIRQLFETMSDERMQIQTLAADDRHAVAEFRSTGTGPDGRAFELEFTEVYEVSNGRIASCRVYIDTAQVPGVDPTTNHGRR
jgi:ketosteroid isomerase-like protein